MQMGMFSFWKNKCCILTIIEKHIYLLVCVVVAFYGRELNGKNVELIGIPDQVSLNSCLNKNNPINSGISLDSSSTPLLKLAGYIDFYYADDMGSKMKSREYGNLVSYARLAEAQLNLAVVKLSVEQDRFRSNLALGVGSFMVSNMLNEPLGLRNVYEANAGVLLQEKGKIWMDIGVLPSHIGFESGVGYECLNLTRSLLAENSPYYESGARITGEYEGLSWGGYVLNGWQTIYRNRYDVKGLDFGLQLNKKWKNLELNYSNIFLGISQNDLTKRIFHNWYLKYQFQKNWNMIVGYDLGKQSTGGSNWENWRSPVLILSKQFGNHRLVARYERYDDPWNIVIANQYPIGAFSAVKLKGYSLNYDYQLFKNVMLRFESRFLQNEKPYLNFALENNSNPRKSMLMFTGALQAKF